MSKSGSFVLMFTVICLQVVVSLGENTNESEPDLHSCSSYSREEVSGLVELIAANNDENANKIKAVKELLASNSSTIDELAKMVRVIASNQQQNSEEMKKIASNQEENAKKITDLKEQLLFAGNSSALDEIVNAVRSFTSNQEKIVTEIKQLASKQQETAKKIEKITSSQQEKAKLSTPKPREESSKQALISNFVGEYLVLDYYLPVFATNVEEYNDISVILTTDYPPTSH